MEQSGETQRPKRARTSWKNENVVKTFLEACIQEVIENGREGASLKGAIGALDGTLVHAVVPIDQQTRFRGRGRDKYFLCDAAYTNTRGFMTPYRNTRYWLADFRRQRVLTKEERFNHAHAQLRNVIERSYGVLKARFPILKQMTPYPFPVQKDIVIACFAIHNFIRRFNIHDQLFAECDANIIFTGEEQQDESNGEGELDGTQWGAQAMQFMANLEDETANQLLTNASV